MNKKSLVMMLVTICLIGVVGVGATFAYLTDTTEQLTNTFTLGKVDITLEEPGFDEVAGEDKTIEDLVPGQTIAKDPTVTVVANSVDSYVFMSVSGIDDMYAAGFEIDGISDAWAKAVDFEDDNDAVDYDGIYVYVADTDEAAIVEKSGSDNGLPALFSSVTYTESNDSNVGGEFNILVKAAAVQADEISPEDALAEVAEGLAF